MTEITVLLLPAIAALFFFLPGMSALLAFSVKKSPWRDDETHFITSSAGLSLAITLIVMFMLLLVSQVTGLPFQFYALPAVLAAVTAAFLLIAVLKPLIRGGPKSAGEYPGPGGKEGGS